MKLVSFEQKGKRSNGVLDNDRISVIRGTIFEEIELTGETVSINEVKLFPPCMPSKAVCIGLNYRDHAEESGMAVPTSPVVFMKPSTAVIAPLDAIEYPALSKRVDYEGELAVVIGTRTKNVSCENAKEHILGYTCANDVTARDLQAPDGQWIIAKGFDTFLPLGPCIETGADPTNLNIKTYLNGEIRQNSNTKNLIFDAYTLVSYISQVMTLNPGDVILTGTPAGIAPMKSGDEVVIEIDGIGRLENFVR